MAMMALLPPPPISPHYGHIILRHDSLNMAGSVLSGWTLRRIAQSPRHSVWVVDVHPVHVSPTVHQQTLPVLCDKISPQICILDKQHVTSVACAQWLQAHAWITFLGDNAKLAVLGLTAFECLPEWMLGVVSLLPNPHYQERAETDVTVASVAWGDADTCTKVTTILPWIMYIISLVPTLDPVQVTCDMASLPTKRALYLRGDTASIQSIFRALVRHTMPYETTQ